MKEKKVNSVICCRNHTVHHCPYKLQAGMNVGLVYTSVTPWRVKGDGEAMYSYLTTCFNSYLNPALACHNRALCVVVECCRSVERVRFSRWDFLLKATSEIIVAAAYVLPLRCHCGIKGKDWRVVKMVLSNTFLLPTKHKWEQSLSHLPGTSLISLPGTWNSLFKVSLVIRGWICPPGRLAVFYTEISHGDFTITFAEGQSKCPNRN